MPHLVRKFSKRRERHLRREEEWLNRDESTLPLLEKKTREAVLGGGSGSGYFLLDLEQVEDILFYVSKAGYISHEKHEGFLKIVRAMNQWRDEYVRGLRGV